MPTLFGEKTKLNQTMIIFQGIKKNTNEQKENKRNQTCRGKSNTPLTGEWSLKNKHESTNKHISGDQGRTHPKKALTGKSHEVNWKGNETQWM